MEVHEVVIQTRLGPESEPCYYFFLKGTMIWPLNFGRGILTEDLQAQKEERKKVKRYQAWRAEGEVHLYLNGSEKELPCGIEFGAPVSSAKKRNI